MEHFTGYIFVMLWAIMTVYLFVQGRKENKIFYLYSIFFLFMTFWYLANELWTVDLFSGIYGWIFRGIVAVVLIITIIIMVINRKNRNGNNDSHD